MSASVVNIAGYRFADMPDRDDLRQPLRDLCQDLGLKGTILLAHEGINFFLAGSQNSIDSFVEWLEADARFTNIPLKISYSDYQPFRRMNVR
ncbi:MAG: sulfurtransferase, partial [Candidatus Thermoplasmatota archaeon]|nr:sulfurtransferase [Candidatus Thermoplasmatota archaeon]